MTIFVDNFWWQFLMTIFDDYSDDFFLWQFLMTSFGDNFWWQFLMTIFDDNFWWQFLMTILMTFFDDNFWWQVLMTLFDIWDTDYNTDNWEPGFMTIFVTWQLIVTLDSIRNSCNVFSVSLFWFSFLYFPCFGFLVNLFPVLVSLLIFSLFWFPC